METDLVNDNSEEIKSLESDSEKIKFFLDNCFGKSSISMFNKLTDLNNQVSLLFKENSQYKSELKDAEKFTSSVGSGKKCFLLICIYLITICEIIQNIKIIFLFQ